MTEKIRCRNTIKNKEHSSFGGRDMGKGGKDLIG